MDMENRIAVLERDVHAIKSELAVIRHDHTDVKEPSGRLRQVEVDLADVSQLKDEVGLVRVELMRLSTLQENCATKADVKEINGNLKGWMLGIALRVMSLNFGMNVIF